MFEPMRFPACTTLLAIAALASPAAYAQATYKFDLPPQSLAESLRAVALQTSTNVLFQSEMVRDLSAPALRAQLTVSEAIGLLLAGTNLRAESMAADTVILQRATTSTTRQTPSSGSTHLTPTQSKRDDEVPKSFWSRFRLARTEAAPSEQVSERAPESSQERIELEEIVVTGTHIRGATDVPAPVRTITRDDIERAGFVTTQDLLESVPQNFSGTTPGGFRTQGASLIAELNTEQAATVDLRGLGPQSTLTLLNGHRQAGAIGGRAFDISTIPLLAIESVEIVTGGRSAIYGADAVAGVANFRTFREYSGFKASGYYGRAEEGAARTQAGTIVGTAGANGGVALAYEYNKDDGLDLVDAGLVSTPSATGGTYPRYIAIPEAERHSAFVTANHDLGEATELSVEGLYSKISNYKTSDEFRPGAAQPDTVTYASDASQLYGAANLRVELSPRWQLESTLYTSRRAVDERQATAFPTFHISVSAEPNTVSTTSSGSVLLQGDLPELLSSAPKIALGAEYRTEDLDYRPRLVFNGTLLPRSAQQKRRRVSAAFVEAYWPVAFGETASADLSFGGRLDHYDDFGSTFNPEAGVTLHLGSSLKLKSAYSRAFRAPSLIELQDAYNAIFDVADDPASSSGTSYRLQLTGFNPRLGPEQAQTWSAGLEYDPSIAGRAHLALDYFQVSYQSRIDVPAAGLEADLALVREPVFQALIDRHPSREEIEAVLQGANVVLSATTPFDPTTQDALTVFPGLVLFDNRYNNIADEKVNGLDFMASLQLPLQTAALNLGADATYTFEHNRSVTATAPAFSLLNEPGKPVDFRARVRMGIEKGRWSLDTFVNYVTDYTNPVLSPAAGVKDWTTVDATLRFVGGKSSAGGPPDGVQVSLIAKNVFGSRPPFITGSGADLIYDGANANPLGRWLALAVDYKF